MEERLRLTQERVESAIRTRPGYEDFSGTLESAAGVAAEFVEGLRGAPTAAQWRELDELIEDADHYDGEIAGRLRDWLSTVGDHGAAAIGLSPAQWATVLRALERPDDVFDDEDLASVAAIIRRQLPT